MAELYLGSEPRVGRFIVLKRILSHLAQEPDFVKMFLDEARIAASLHHPNIIEVFELGQIENSLFFVMEWVEGMDLRRILQAEQARGGVVPAGIAAWATARLCEGLGYAHSRVDDQGRKLGIIHRDVSPQNVMLSYQGEVKLVDFGIAKATAWVARSKPGIIKGKFLYLAPEQLAELPLDSRCDLFSLGTMLYELTTGKNPFYRPETEGVIYAVRMEDPPPPHTLRPGYPRSLSRIIQKCLVKDRDHRYQTAEEIRVALEEVLRVEMPTTKADVVAYVSGLFGDEADRTGVHVPKNAQIITPLMKAQRDAQRPLPSEMAEGERSKFSARTSERDDEGTASMPAPSLFDDQDDERTASDGPDHGGEGTVLLEASAAPSDSRADRTAPMTARDEPPASTERVVGLTTSPSSTFAQQIALPPLSAKFEGSGGGSSGSNEVQDISFDSLSPSSAFDELIVLPPSSPMSKRGELPGGDRADPSGTQLQVPSVLPRLKRAEPPVSDEETEPAGHPGHARRIERPAPPVETGTAAPVRRAMQEVPVAVPVPQVEEQPRPPVRQKGPGPTNLSPLAFEADELRRAVAPPKPRRIVKRRVAGDPDDHVSTVDFRDARHEFSGSEAGEEDDDERDEERVSVVLVATTIAMATLALVMIAWLLWPTSPTPSSGRNLGSTQEPAQTEPPGQGSLVSVQVRAPKATLIYLGGALINPGEMRLVPPGPLALAYRCVPVKRGQKSRDLTLATRVPANGPQPFVIELHCPK